MKRKPKGSPALLRQINNLRLRLKEAEQVLYGIRAGEVDALVISGPGGERVYTLQGAEQPYRILIEAMNEGALTLAADGTILYANAHFAQMVKSPLEKVIGSPLDRFVVRADRRRLAKLVRQHGPAGQTAAITLLASDNAQLRTQFSVVSLADAGPQNKCVAVADLTEIFAAHEALRRSEERYRALTTTITELVWAADADGQASDDLPGWRAFTGQSSSEVRGRGWLNAVHPEERERVAAAWAQAVEAKSVFRIEHRVRRHDGQYRYFANCAVPVLAEGDVREWVGACTDITERMQAEQRLRDLLESAPDAMVVVNAEGKIVVVNAKVKEVFGYEREELLGKTLDVLIPERFRGTHAQDYVRFFLSPHGRPMGTGLDLYGLRKDGTEFPLDISLSPLETEEGTLVISNARDVTRRKRAEEEIRQLSGRLLQAQEDERRRLARELHDSAAQALAAIGINLSVVQKSARMGKTARRCLADAIEMASECSDEIRNISHSLHPLVLDERNLSAALKWYVGGFTRRTKIAVDLKVSAELDGLPKETETALFRIVQEGLTNVFRHSGSPRATVELARNSGEVILQIVDEGKGMGSAGIDMGRNLYAGPGIGMLSMRERARQIGGNFEIASSGKGTTLRVTLPFLIK
jgi:PAS domain S-box-containing protein